MSGIQRVQDCQCSLHVRRRDIDVVAASVENPRNHVSKRHQEKKGCEHLEQFELATFTSDQTSRACNENASKAACAQTVPILTSRPYNMLFFDFGGLIYGTQSSKAIFRHNASTLRALHANIQLSPQSLCPLTQRHRCPLRRPLSRTQYVPSASLHQKHPEPLRTLLTSNVQ